MSINQFINYSIYQTTSYNWWENILIFVGAVAHEITQIGQEGRLLECRYNPTEVGIYTVSIKWNDEEINTSPVHVYVFDTYEELNKYVSDSILQQKLSYWQTDKMNLALRNWLADWLANRPTDQAIDWLADWLTGQTDWLTLLNISQVYNKKEIH